MNLLDAVRTGKPIKRQCWDDYLTFQEHDPTKPSYDPALQFPNRLDPKLSKEDLLSDDWVAAEVVTTDRQTLKILLKFAMAKYPCSCRDPNDLLEQIISDLLD